MDYIVVDWDFADPAPTSPPVQQPAPGEPCPPGTKMIWGLCRRVNASGEQQVGDDTDQEKTLKQQATKEGSAFENNKAVSAGGKKYGWAMKGNKPILVEWGSVAGTKPKSPPSTGAGATASPAPQRPL